MKTHALQKGVVWLLSLAAILVFSELLFAHTGQTSGVPNQDIAPKVNEYLDSVVKAGWFNGTILIARDGKLVISQGNNNGYILLGHVIERVSEGSYEGFLRENIFVPLKMTDTGYDNHLPITKNRAAGYVSEGGKLFNAVYVDQSQPFAAGRAVRYNWRPATSGSSFIRWKVFDAENSGHDVHAGVRRIWTSTYQFNL